jgi:pimeloyl-ACP methyl ester carboxylesterase
MPRFDIAERGNTTAARTIIFVHGWPDTDAVFEAQYEVFAATHRLVTLSIPGYRRDGAAIPFFGYAVDVVAEMLYDTIVDVMKGRDETPSVVAHDWGSRLTFMVDKRHPGTIARIVALDIAGHVGPRRGVALLIVLWYQWSLAGLALLPRGVANPLTWLFAKYVLRVANPAGVHGGMNYMYLRVWWATVTRQLPMDIPWREPTVPVLFLYGAKQPLHFHSDRWVRHLEATAGSAVRPHDGGHWFFMRHQQAAAVNDDIRAFLPT